MSVAIAVLQAKPDAAEALARALSALVEPSREDSGTIQYVLHRDLAEPTRFVVYERYVDDAALDAHMNAPWLAAALASIEEHLAGPPVVSRLDPLAGFYR